MKILLETVATARAYTHMCIPTLLSGSPPSYGSKSIVPNNLDGVSLYTIGCLTTDTSVQTFITLGGNEYPFDSVYLARTDTGLYLGESSSYTNPWRIAWSNFNIFTEADLNKVIPLWIGTIAPPWYDDGNHSGGNGN